ncbi:STN domain-containing protein, partial [Gillisia limnaea]
MNTKLQFFPNYLTKSYLFLVVGILICSAGTKAWSAINNDIQISIQVKNASITEVFSAIEDETGFTFVFDESISNANHSFTFQFENERLERIFQRITTKTGFQFKKINHTISVMKPDIQ